MEEAPVTTARWVALPILGCVFVGITAVVCSLIAASSLGLAAEVWLGTVALVVVVWFLGHSFAKDDA